jgi:hypothetical protein
MPKVGSKKSEASGNQEIQKKLAVKSVDRATSSVSSHSAVLNTILHQCSCPFEATSFYVDCTHEAGSMERQRGLSQNGADFMAI